MAAIQTIRTANPTILAAAALLAGAGAAHGQNALGGGRALDRNLNANESRYNATAPRIEDQVRLNNALITGNVTGGRQFRGSIGYGAVNDFGARVGSDDLYSFRRDSAISGVSGLGIRASDALRYQFAAATGQAPPSYIGTGINIAQRSDAAATSATAAGSITAGSLRSTSEYLTGQSVRPALVGTRVDDRGYELTARSSPLIGINWIRSDAPLYRTERPEDRISADDLGNTRNPNATPIAPQGDTNPDNRRSLPGTSGAESVAPGIASPFDRESMAPTSRAPSGRLEPVSAAHQAVVGAFRQGFGVEPGQAANGGTEGATDANGDTRAAGGRTGEGRNQANGAKTPVDNSLDAQLGRLRQQLTGAEPSRPPFNWNPGAKPKAAGAQAAQPGDATDTTNGGQAQAPAVPAIKPGAGSLTAPLAGAPSTAESGRSELERILRPNGQKAQAPSPSEIARPLSASERLTPEMSRALRNTGSVRLERLSHIEVVAPPIKPDLPAHQSAMEAGDDLFAKGRYFDAEDRYTRALAAMPRDPMAQVGRAHSQLAAGLFLSAASNLRRLFADHPEMIGAQYTGVLALPPERAGRIVEQLREQMGRDSSGLGRDSAFLLGYVGHLTQNDALVADGLAEMVKRSEPKNEADGALIDACRAAWTK